MNMSQTALHAIRAAKKRSKWGRWATRRYCANNGVSMALYRLARQLEATKGIGQ